MNRMLLDTLYGEENLLLEELRSSALFRRYEAVRRLLDLYDAPAPVGADLDQMMDLRPMPAAPVPVRAAKPQGTLRILENIASEMRSEVA